MPSPERESHRAECQKSECPREWRVCRIRACALLSWLSPLLSDEVDAWRSANAAMGDVEPLLDRAAGPGGLVDAVRGGQCDFELGIAMIVEGLDDLARRGIRASIRHSHLISLRIAAPG